METKQENSDLIWNLGVEEMRKRATRFVMDFENRLCVYSPSVEQIYTTYNMHVPRQQDHNLIILPDPFAFHDTFSHVNHEAVTQTALFIVPGDVIKRPGYFIMVPTKDKKKKLLPLSHAIKIFVENRPADDPFLPILVKGDLKPFSNQLPCLHLHRLEPSKVKGLSGFAVHDMQKAIISRLEQLVTLTEKRTTAH